MSHCAESPGPSGRIDRGDGFGDSLEGVINGMLSDENRRGLGFGKASVLPAMQWRSLGVMLCLCAALLHGRADGAEPVATDGTVSDDAGDFYDDAYEDDGEIIADPLEPLNRAIFVFNDKLYFYVLKPTARAYRVLPQGVRVSVSNFFSNLAAPIRMVNALFQFKLLDAGGELLRFGVNTTVGLGGLFDPAQKYLGLREKDEDFGQTLGSYGIGQGFYLVLPGLGSSSARDGIGRLVDGYYFDPVVIVPDETSEVVALKALDMVNFISLDKDTYEIIKRESLDPYTFIKNAYAQSRAGKVER
ncbi:MAG: VacJ family lipoprotein [Gammaproteobacteria bacterium]|nr:VacJ family lipoprotein [Gammaproteobacteria bacterium]